MSIASDAGLRTGSGRSIEVPTRFERNCRRVGGAAGAVIIAGWLVEAKQSVIENMAPVLTKVFTPLTTLLLLAFLAAAVVTGNPVDAEVKA